MPLTHPTVRNVQAALRAAGATGAPIALPDSAPTAVAAAAQLGCAVGAIANSLIFNADGEPLLILTSGAHRVDTGHVADRINVSAINRADPEFVRRHTGMAIGGVAPIGHPAPIRTLVDHWLRQYDQVWAAAGHAHTVFPTTFDELLRITGGEAIDVE